MSGKSPLNPRFLVLLAVVALAVLLSGCSSRAPPVSPAAPAASSQAAPATAMSTEITIEMKNIQFSQKEVTIPVGATVTWVNTDPVEHDVTSDDTGGELKSPLLKTGEKFTHTFAKTGTYKYHCTPHSSKNAETGEFAGMTGVIRVVEAASAPASSGSPAAGAVAPLAATPIPASSNVKVVDGVQVVSLEASEFKFAPMELKLKPGKTKFIIVNKGVVPHELHLYPEAEARQITETHIGEHLRGYAPTTGLVVGVDARVGERSESDIIDLRPGTYEMGCHIPGHYEAGMKGRVIVTDGVPSPSPTPAAARVLATPAPYTGPVADIVRKGADVPPPITRKEPATVRIDLETREVVGELADGVYYRYWTFNGTVPGPMLRVRVDDTVELHLKNAPDGTMPHSIDLHAVTGPGGGAVLTQTPPGKEKAMTFKALNPGVYIYHCASPHIPSHVANGMYGMILVEPKEGLPPVDREFYVVQGEWYTQAKRGERGLQAFDFDKMQLEHPEYVTFNGKVAALTGANAMKAKVGEKVRIYIGVGAFLPSSFHVIGEIFDRVYPEGALRDAHRDVQTTMVPAGGAAAVEFTLEVPGNYILVDHSLTRALDKGAVGILQVEGPENPQVFQAVTPAGGGESAGH
ncbi:MAG: nitrite reductase, copper-containing [Euryarchaeota archaeon]|nr:nitrite reductase, copper-containing [Euryarchaeota archaeon]